MTTFRLRHFLTFLFHSRNEHVVGFREFAASAKSCFVPDLSSIVYSEGVRLILRAADRLFYIQENAFSEGMYLHMLKQEIADSKVGPFMREQIEAEIFDPLFDDLIQD